MCVPPPTPPSSRWRQLLDLILCARDGVARRWEGCILFGKTCSSSACVSCSGLVVVVWAGRDWEDGCEGGGVVRCGPRCILHTDSSSL